MSRRAAGGYDLQQPKLRRLVEARLGKLSETLQGLDPTTPFWRLPKETAIDIFVAGICAAYEAGCDPYELNDEIPF